MSKKTTPETETEPRRMIGYARVSTADQNPDMQISRAAYYAWQRKWDNCEITDIFDDGES